MDIKAIGWCNFVLGFLGGLLENKNYFLKTIFLSIAMPCCDGAAFHVLP
jgi:hypothetical protein